MNSSDIIPKGYKLTEVGVIPDDWGTDCIENLADIKTGSKNTQDRIDDGKYPFYVRSTPAATRSGKRNPTTVH